MGKILIFREKHGDRTFSTPTRQDECAACLHIFNERYKEGYWYESVKEAQKSLDKLVAPDIPKAQTETMQDEGLRNTILERWDKYYRNLRYLEKGLENAKECELIYNNQDGVLARHFILGRQGKYETVIEDYTEEYKPLKIPAHFQVQVYKGKENYKDPARWLVSVVKDEIITTDDPSKALVSTDYEKLEKSTDKWNKRFGGKGKREDDQYGFFLRGLSIQTAKYRGFI
jgi:hypothetical protein